VLNHIAMFSHLFRQYVSKPVHATNDCRYDQEHGTHIIVTKFEKNNVSTVPRNAMVLRYNDSDELLHINNRMLPNRQQGSFSTSAKITPSSNQQPFSQK